MINWNKVVALRLLLPFVGGIAVERFCQTAIPGIELILALLMVLLIYLAHRRGIRAAFWRFGSVVFVVLSLLGYYLANEHRLNLRSDHIGHFIGEQATSVVGHIGETPILKNGNFRFTLQVEATGSADTVRSVQGDILVYLRADSTTGNRPRYGDRVSFRGNIREVASAKNPHAFDYANYLAQQNIFHQVYLKPDKLITLDSGGGSALLRTAYDLRTQFVNILRAHLPDAQAFSVGSALILGYKDEMDPEVRDTYAATGAMHVLAVSGLHVGIVAMILNFIFKTWLEPRNARWRLYKLPLVLAGIWAFALLTGLPPSVQRAAMMFSLLTLGDSLDKNRNIYNTLVISAILLLAWNPALLFDVGFQLSYSAVFGIIHFQPKLAQLWKPRYRAVDILWQLTTVSVAAQLFTLPLSLYYFHQFPVYFWLSGLVVVQAATLILSLGILLFAVSWLAPLAMVVGKILYGIITAMNWIVFAIGALPGAVIRGFWLPLWVVVAAYLSLAGFLHSLAAHRVRGVLFGLALLTAIGVHYSFTAYRQLDQQEMVIYQTRQGILIDCFYRNRCTTLKTSDLSASNEQFAAENNRWSRGLIHRSEVRLDSMANFQNDYLSYRSGAFRFAGTTVYVASDAHTDLVPTPDLVLIGKDLSGDYQALRSRYPNAQILLAADLPYRASANWKKALKQAERDYIDLKESGAFLLSEYLNSDTDE